MQSETTDETIRRRLKCETSVEDINNSSNLYTAVRTYATCVIMIID